MTLDITKMRLSTKGLVAFLIGLGSLLQIPAIETPLLAAAKQHPHVATILAALTSIAAVLHNPKVEKLLGIQTSTTTTAVGEVVQSVTTQTPVVVQGTGERVDAYATFLPESGLSPSGLPVVNAIAAVPSVPASDLLPTEPTADAVTTK